MVFVIVAFSVADTTSATHASQQPHLYCYPVATANSRQLCGHHSPTHAMVVLWLPQAVLLALYAVLSYWTAALCGYNRTH